MSGDTCSIAVLQAQTFADRYSAGVDTVGRLRERLPAIKSLVEDPLGFTSIDTFIDEFHLEAGVLAELVRHIADLADAADRLHPNVAQVDHFQGEIDRLFGTLVASVNDGLGHDGLVSDGLGDDGERSATNTWTSALLAGSVNGAGFRSAGTPVPTEVRGTRSWADGDEDIEYSSITVTFEPVPGGGVVKIDQFIAANRAGVPGARDAGNDRSFDLDADISESKVQIVIDLDAGVMTATAAGSCDGDGNACHDARAWQFISPEDDPTRELNNISLIRDDDGVRVQFRGLNSRRDDKALLKIPSIDGVYRFDYDDGTLHSRTKGDPFPSEQVSWTPSGSDTPQEVFRFTEKVNLVGRSPRLSTHSWDGLSDDFFD